MPTYWQQIWVEHLYQLHFNTPPLLPNLRLSSLISFLAVAFNLAVLYYAPAVFAYVSVTYVVFLYILSTSNISASFWFIAPSSYR